MFNIGFSELLILGVIGLIVLGPEQLPEVAKKLAKLLNDLKRAKDEIMSPVVDLKRQSYQLLEDARRKAAQVEFEAQQAMKLNSHQGDVVPPPEHYQQQAVSHAPFQPQQAAETRENFQPHTHENFRTPSAQTPTAPS